jgi:predicted HicB family RNase H-like nuclease
MDHERLRVLIPENIYKEIHRISQKKGVTITKMLRPYLVKISIGEPSKAEKKVLEIRSVSKSVCDNLKTNAESEGKSLNQFIIPILLKIIEDYSAGTSSNPFDV